MLVGVIDVAEERGAEDAEREEEAEGEAEEDGGEDGVGDDHRVHVPAAALLLELPTIRGIVLQPTVIDSPFIQRVPKKMSFLGKIATTTFKLIQNAKAGGVLENSGYLLPDGH